MAAISMAQKKAQSENQDLQNQANALRQQQVNMGGQPTANYQLPTINSVFGQ